jgi:putative ABC transport system permease protein
VQVAFSYVLLIGAGLMVRSFIEMNRVDPGFVPQRLFAIGVSVNFNKYNTPELRQSIVNRLLERVKAQPGVVFAALSSSFPLDPEQLSGSSNPSQLKVEGDSRPETELPGIHSVRSATPDYFKTLGVPVVAGRTFLDSDNAGAPAVCILNRALAQRAWRDRDPIGRRLSVNNGRRWLQVVGVVGSTKEFGLGTETPNQIYIPLAQNPFTRIVLVRTAGESIEVAEMVRRSIRDLDPQIAIFRMETLEQARTDSLASPRTMARLFGLFAVLAMVIAVTGVGGMLALWVRQRTREIGIRMAMGAQPRDIVRSVIRQGMVLVVIGLSLGFSGALAVTRTLTKLLFQVQPTDTETYIVVSAALLAAAMIACSIPARRAARIDPQIALRCD